jgi:hypothetical protein
MSTTTTPSTAPIRREILRYEREVWKEDMRDPVRLAIWRTPRAMFCRQCAQAWRDFALAVEKLEAPLVSSPPSSPQACSA